MTRRRCTPEEPRSRETFPLFDSIESARARADVGMERASSHAEHVEPGWRQSALEAVRSYARGHDRFLAENVPIAVPSEADPRAVGAVFREAQRRGWIRADGFAPANSSNRSAKVRWLSLLFGGAR